MFKLYTSPKRLCLPAVLVGLACALPSGARAQAIEMSREVADLYISVSINPPTADSMTVCYGFVCRRRAILDFTAADQAALTKILASGKASPAAERAAVQQAVIWWDKRVGPMIGTNVRIARADIRHNADATNFDCWDTTRNVASLLLILQEWKLLKHHTVGNPKYRGNVFALQTPHNTPVLVQTSDRSEWVVDLWTRKYAEAPEVMLVAEWMKLD